MQNDNQNDILPELIAAGIDPATAIVVSESEKSENKGCLGVILIAIFTGILYVI